MGDLGPSHGLRPVIWSNDNPPPHVHFFSGRGNRGAYVALYIATGEEKENKGVPSRYVLIARTWLAQQRAAFQRAWDEIHKYGKVAQKVPPYRAHRSRP